MAELIRSENKVSVGGRRYTLYVYKCNKCAAEVESRRQYNKNIYCSDCKRNKEREDARNRITRKENEIWNRAIDEFLNTILELDTHYKNLDDEKRIEYIKIAAKGLKK